MKKGFIVILVSIFVIGNVDATNKVVKFRAENMKCGECSDKIKKTVTAIDGVSDFSADLEKRMVIISYEKE
jgi:copper chaperone CopZ